MTAFYPQETIDQVNQRLDVRQLIQTIGYRPEKYQQGPKTGKGFCPIHREGLFRNLVVDLESRTFRCQYTQCPGSKGGSLVGLYSQALGIDIDVAVRRIVREQNLDVELPINRVRLDAMLEGAGLALSRGNHDEAERGFNDVLDVDPDNPEGHHGLLKVYEARGETEKRADKLIEVCRLKIAAGRAGDIPELIQEWTEVDSDSPDARFAFAELLVAEGDAEAAVIELMGGGDACEGRGELEAAIHAYKRAAAISVEKQIDVIDVAPHIIRVLTQLGRTPEAVDYLYAQGEKLLQNEQFESAADYYLMAIEADPGREESHRRFLAVACSIAPTPELSAHVLHSAEALRDAGDYESAMHALEQFMAVAPDDEGIIRALINDYNNHGRAAEAFDLEARLAGLLYDHGHQDEAREIIDNLLTWQPQHVGMLRVVTHIQQQEGDPEEPETRRRLVRALLAQSRWGEALEEAGSERLRQEDPEVMELRASALEGMARAGDHGAREKAIEILESIADRHLEETTGRRAVGYLQRAIDLTDEPTNEILFKLARAHLRNKDFPQVRDTVITVCENLVGQDRLDEAILEAERYSNLIPEDTDLVRYLVELYLRFDDGPAAVARMRRLAEDLIRNGKTQEAEEIIEQANDLEPKNLESLVRQLDHYLETGNKDKINQTRLRIVALYQEEGNHAEAAAMLETHLRDATDDVAAMNTAVQIYDGLKQKPEARRWRLQLAKAYRGSGDFDREARVLRDALKKLADDEEVLTLLTQAEFSRGDMQAGAANALRLAAIQRNGGKPESARKTLMKAVENVPENLEINREIFAHFADARQAPQAITWGKKVIGLLKSAGKLSDAASLFDQLVELDPDNLSIKQEQLKFLENTGRESDLSEKRLVLSRIYREQERFQDAETLLEAIIKTDPRHIAARHELADLFHHLGDNGKAEAQLLQIAALRHLEGETQEAIQVLQSVIASNPAHTEARRHLAQIYRSDGDPTAAVAVLLEVAAVYRKGNMETEAIAAEREALELDPYNEKLNRTLVDSLKAAGREGQACDQLEKVARHTLEKGEPESALKLCNEIIELQPNRLSARKLRAELYGKLGKSDQALEELQQIAELAVSGASMQVDAVGQQPDNARRTALQIVPEYTFDNFVVGSNSDFAHATALAIARSPARAYNPFFLYANVGLGKTHLCNAIANYLLERDPSTNIIYTNSEDFTDELVTAIQNNDVQQFRTRYRNLDLLIVDDVQFLAGKERAQEEFFHIFNSLFQAKRQIIIASDRPPAEIAHLESRLRSRFGAGVIVDIASPDVETRIAILNREIEEGDLGLEAWVARSIAEKVDSNVRDLKGALNQVVATRDLRKQELTEESVSGLLETLYPASAV